MSGRRNHAARVYALARFEREARAAAALSHPNVLGIHDFDSDAGIAYAVLELLEGRTLREWIAAGPVPPRKAVEWMVQVTRGLAAAHARGIVHRDLKPENLFLTATGIVGSLSYTAWAVADRAVAGRQPADLEPAPAPAGA